MQSNEQNQNTYRPLNPLVKPPVGDFADREADRFDRIERETSALAAEFGKRATYEYKPPTFIKEPPAGGGGRHAKPW